MTRPSFVLRCMFGISRPDRPDIVSLPIPESDSTILIAHIAYSLASGQICLRTEDDTNTGARDVLARLRIRTPTVELESFVNCAIEEPPSELFPATYDTTSLDVFRSRPAERCFTRLRLKDTIDFRDQNLKLEFTVESTLPHPPLDSVAAMPPSLSQQDVESVSATEHTEPEDHMREPLSEEDAETDDDDLDGPTKLPPERVSPLVNPPNATPVLEESEDDDDSVVSSALRSRNQITYGSRRKRAKSSSPIKAKGDAYKARVKDMGTDDADGDDDLVVPPTSEPLRSPDVAQEAASRSMSVRATPQHATDSEASSVIKSGKLPSVSKAGKKRKFEPRLRSPYDIPDDVPEPRTATRKSASAGNEDEDDIEPPKKRGRSSKRSKLPKAASLEESDDEISMAAKTPTLKSSPKKPSAPEESGDERVVTAKSSTGKAPLKGLSGFEESDDEIVVAAKTPTFKSSPKKSTNPEESGDEIVVKMKAPGRKTASKKSATHRSTSSTSTPLSGRTPKVLLSSSFLSKNEKGWLTKQKVQVVEETPSKRTHFACVVRNQRMPSTIKVLKTLVANKMVVGDRWVTESKKEGKLLSLEDYVHPDLEGNVANKARQTLFASKILFFTPQALRSYGQDWPEIQQLASDTGARAVEHGSAWKGHQLQPKQNVIFFGINDERDDEAATLISDSGRHVYDRSMLSQSIIRAELDLESEEFRLSLPLPAATGKGKSEKASKK